MTTPEPSTLNWSNVKPTFGEVEGKTVYVETKSNSGIVVRFSRVVKDFEIYNIDFDNNFVRYAILGITQPDPEPLPLWGKMPEIPSAGKSYPYKLFARFLYVRGGDQFEITTFLYPTRSEVIEAWNKLAIALNEIQL